MKSLDIRKQFLDFFKSKEHLIVSSSPMVVKNDPTLMFTNAGMNQFKDIFLGNAKPKAKRVANTQKCLRVSGKHNDLEEVGIDTYHHTMFEMLGNWSFGDYFKKEAIEWSWELLTEVYGIDKDRLYVTVFGGDKLDNTEMDNEAYNIWKEIIPEDRIILGSKKDNFWEMGDMGPCGPCSEVHVDIRDKDVMQKISGKELVNTDNPEVIEIWNLVFIQYERIANGSLKNLPSKHIDTGMGFERLAMVLQKKKSNYDTDIFQPLIKRIAMIACVNYGDDYKKDVAMRVISDHLRAVAFAIADGEIPSNNKAGYVIRRILRRAVRYAYTFLDIREPIIYNLVDVLIANMGDTFPELTQRKDLIEKIIFEEEASFLRTLESGLKRIEQIINELNEEKTVSGKKAFELYDTFGFPIDLTRLILKEKNLEVNEEEFNIELQKQKQRSKDDASIDSEDWIIVNSNESETDFVGYDFTEIEANIIKYRKVKNKDGVFYQLVFSKTPFYGESGGQVGDRGIMLSEGEDKIEIFDTKKENNLIVHFIKSLPTELNKTFKLVVNIEKRQLTEANHSATHLLHSALRMVLGTHVQQKGSLVNDEHLRFDFSHFSKLTDEEIAKVEEIVNTKIRENICIDEKRNMHYEEAVKDGATALFGEKYGDYVRVITFDKEYSVELCGGTHVRATGNIGFFKIISETAIAAGIRRITAISSSNAEKYINDNLKTLDSIRELFQNPKDVLKSIINIIDQNNQLTKQLDLFKQEKIKNYANTLLDKVKKHNDINYIIENIEVESIDSLKDIAYSLKSKTDKLFCVLTCENENKASLVIIISEELVILHKLNASTLVKELAKEINGGGGGQAYFATAGGKKPEGINNLLNKAKEFVYNIK
ncbi:MAG: alanine--tRNA ligase [Bacteroidetes bacterium GWE2_29_8]|nr:MAG: alanine--tRNA ligase [Bacteroidetes bacterium GWE2_29_8]OFY22378.1 MAG: alanine--tRNA ligase [Bacteroidetes bacterium GWF2_29_10]